MNIYILIIIVLSLIIICLVKKVKELYDDLYIDKITKLGNANYFLSKSKELLQNKNNLYIGVINLDKYKIFKTIYNAEQLEILLNNLKDKLQSLLPNSLICHLSDNIFGIMFYYDKKIDSLMKNLIAEIKTLKIDSNEGNIFFNIGIGIYKINKNDSDINKIFAKVLIAYEDSKNEYYNNYSLYEKSLEKKVQQKTEIEASMLSALKDKEFKVVYQPKIYVKSEKLAGAEALVRWQKKDGQIIFPNSFIPLFEQNKFILMLDLYIFERVCQDISLWQEKGIKCPIISVNVSKEHFTNEHFIVEYIALAKKYNVDPAKIDLEITESVASLEKEKTLRIIKSIKKAGFIVSIDDFGMEYSSLGMLEEMKVDILKVDKAFIDKADLKSKNNIINHIIYIARNLNIKTIIEGVETEEQVEFIKKIKGDMIQGYYYSKPLNKKEFVNIFLNDLK